MGYDKKLHVLAGLFIGLAFGLLAPWLGLIMACIAGVVKELWDAARNAENEPDTATVEVGDIMATVAGGVMAEVILSVFR